MLESNRGRPIALFLEVADPDIPGLAVRHRDQLGPTGPRNAVDFLIPGSWTPQRKTINQHLTSGHLTVCYRKCPFIVSFPSKTVISHSYVSLPEGIYFIPMCLMDKIPANGADNPKLIP